MAVLVDPALLRRRSRGVWSRRIRRRRRSCCVRRSCGTRRIWIGCRRLSAGLCAIRRCRRSRLRCGRSRCRGCGARSWRRRARTRCRRSRGGAARRRCCRSWRPALSRCRSRCGPSWRLAAGGGLSKQPCAGQQHCEKYYDLDLHKLKPSAPIDIGQNVIIGGGVGGENPSEPLAGVVGYRSLG